MHLLQTGMILLLSACSTPAIAPAGNQTDAAVGRPRFGDKGKAADAEALADSDSGVDAGTDAKPDAEADAEVGTGADAQAGADSQPDDDAEATAPVAPLFLLSIDNASRWLQKVDVTTGKTTNLCKLGNTDAYPSLTFRRDNGLMASRKASALDAIDPCTCQITPIGSYGGASSVNGITSDHSQGLFGLSAGLQALIAIDVKTGAAKTVGPLGIELGAHGATWSDGLQALYAINGKDDSLYVVDPKTGKATLKAKLSKPFGMVGMELHPQNGKIYACSDNNVLYEVDQVTGQVTEVGPMAQAGPCTNLAAPWVPFSCAQWPK